MPPIFVLVGGLRRGAIVHRLIKEVRRINVELDRVKTGRAIDRSARTASPKRTTGKGWLSITWASAVLPVVYMVSHRLGWQNSHRFIPP